MESFLYDTFYEEVTSSKTKPKYKKIRRPGECKVCGKLFNDKNAVYVHMRIHTGEKPYVCEICGKGFNQNSNLKRHLKYHRGERPYHCDVCNKDISCSSRPHFLEHVRAHDGEKPYACELCDKSYSFKASLINHMKSHAKTHFFACDLCNAGFSYEGQLNNHMRTHDADYEANKCEICKEVFPATYKLSDHLAKSHEIFTAYECKVCQKRYYNQQALRLHYEEHLEVPSSASKRRKKKNLNVPEEENSMSNDFKNQNEDIPNVTETEGKDITDVSISTSCVKEVITPEQLEILLRRGNVSHRESNEYFETVDSENFYIIRNEDISTVAESEAKVIPTSLTWSSQVEEVITPDYPELILGQDAVNHTFVCGVCEKEFRSEGEIDKHFETHIKSKNESIIPNENISKNESIIPNENLSKNESIIQNENLSKNESIIQNENISKNESTIKNENLSKNESVIRNENISINVPIIQNEKISNNVSGVKTECISKNVPIIKTKSISKNLPIVKTESISNVAENNSKEIDVVTSSTRVKTVITEKDLKLLLSRGPVNHRFLCGVCGKDFSSKTEIDIHLKTHTKVEKLFICGLCKERFSSGDELKSHINNTHDI